MTKSEMPNDGPAAEFEFAQMSLFSWLMEDERHFCTLRSIPGSAEETTLCVLKERGASGGLGFLRLYPTRARFDEAADRGRRIVHGKKRVALAPMVSAGLVLSAPLSGQDASTGIAPSGSLAARLGAEHAFVPSEDGRKWWASHGRLAFENMLARAAVERRGVERTVLIGRECYFKPDLADLEREMGLVGVEIPMHAARLKIPIAVATVVREKGDCVFIESVRAISHLPGVRALGARPFIGAGPNFHVLRSSIMADHATPDMEENACAFAREMAGMADREARKLLREIAPKIKEALKGLKDSAATVKFNIDGALAAPSMEDFESGQGPRL